VSSAPVQALTVATAEAGAPVTFAHGQVDGARHPGQERNGGGQIALADDGQDPVARCRAA
jgi:hypothetical protein